MPFPVTACSISVARLDCGLLIGSSALLIGSAFDIATSGSFVPSPESRTV
jgi:hypothetical protein